MTDNEKLAKVLGTMEKIELPSKPDELYCLHIDSTGERFLFPREEDTFKRWLASPAGEKAVRDRVRKLAGADSVAYYYEPGDELKHTVCVSSNELDFCPWRTEAEAWNEALIWLAERGD